MSDSPQQSPLPIGMPPALAQRLFAPGNIPETFANQMRMGVTVTDFTLVFGTAIDAGPNMAPVALDRSIIHVAPGMLKQIFQNIAMAVEAYEEVMGEIKLPHQLAANLANVKAHLVVMLRQQMDAPAPSATSP